MKWIREEVLISAGQFPASRAMSAIRGELKAAVYNVVWPSSGRDFAIRPEKHANGVGPIKSRFVETLEDNFGWESEFPSSIGTKGGKATGEIDVAKQLPDGRWFAVEWETGNISSSHRSVNKLALGLLEGAIAGGILVLPSRALYPYLTDRIGSYDELSGYFPLWRHVSVADGFLAVVSVEHDRTDARVRRIPKGTDGRALR